MPRRRTRAGAASKAFASSRQSQWNFPDDVPLDEEDRFQRNRDKILLDGDDASDEDDWVDDEVFPLHDHSEPSSGDEQAYDKPANAHAPVLRPKSQRKSIALPAVPSVHSDTQESDDDGWGKSKSAYYASKESDLDSDDEETNALFLHEAIKLQDLSRVTLMLEDFGLTDYDAMTAGWEQDTITTVTLSQYSEKEDFNHLRVLERACPEAIALARDWDIVIQKLEEVETILHRPEFTEGNNPRSGLLHLYHQTLLSYIAVLAFYFNLCSARSGRGPTEVRKLRSHPVLERLLVLREASLELEDFGFDESSSDDDQSSLDQGEPRQLDLDQILRMASSPAADVNREAKEIKQTGKKVAMLRGETDELNEPKFQNFQTRAEEKVTTDEQELTHFGDPSVLQIHDAEDKRARKKSLRFHTSRIDVNQLRRTGHTSHKGGDDDIPYPDRRAQPKRSVSLSSAVDHLGMKRPRSDSENSDDDMRDDDGYYQLVQHQSRKKKENKKIQYEASLAEQRWFPDIQSQGPRSLTRAIMANKGLTNHRSKSIRNPRVKKRMRYEKAKQKLSSQRPSHKGAPKGGKYLGEQSGISARTVKSVRL